MGKQPVKQRTASLYRFYRDLKRNMSANIGAIQTVDLILGEEAGIDQLVVWLAEPEKIQQALAKQKMVLADKRIRIPGPDPPTQVIRAILYKLSHLDPYKLAKAVVEAQDSPKPQQIRQDQ